jgi:hypothetical protein
VSKFQPERVQRLPPDAKVIGSAVDWIARHGVPQVGEVHPDLVCATRHQLDLHERVMRKALADPVPRDGRAPAGDDCHAGAVMRVAADGRINHPLVPRELPIHERNVRTADRPGGHLGLQSPICPGSLGHHKQTGSVLVETVDDSRP